MTGRAADLYDEVASILERHDPMGVVLEELDPELEPLDEYDPETTAIVARLGAAASAEDVERVVHEVFRQWFDDEPAGLDAVARDIWALLLPQPHPQG